MKGILNIGSAIALWVIISTYLFLSYRLPSSSSSITTTVISSSSPLTLSLLLFNNLNIFISICEIILGCNIHYVQSDYRTLCKKYKKDGKEGQACLSYLTMPLSIRQLFQWHTWAKMWSTYALYDPSYQNQESFGFFIDFGNGLTTIPPSVLINVAIVRPDLVSALWVGCIGIAMYWQVMYGTIIYIFSFVFNRRYEGKTLLEVALFVGLTNSLWFIFPTLGIYACVCMLRDGNMDVFR